MPDVRESWPRAKHRGAPQTGRKKKPSSKKKGSGAGSLQAKIAAEQAKIAAELARTAAAGSAASDRQPAGPLVGGKTEKKKRRQEKRAALAAGIGGGVSTKRPRARQEEPPAAGLRFVADGFEPEDNEPAAEGPALSWAERAAAKRELKAAAKRNKRNGNKCTTNKEKIAAAAAKATATSEPTVRTKDVTVGHGLEPVTLGSRVRVLYEGRLPSGATFDRNSNSAKPLQFVVGEEEVIAGFERGVIGMRAGGERVIAVPPSMGYGDAPPPGGSLKARIPPNSHLQFVVQLLDFY